MIGQPRTKTDTELSWSAIKRAVAARVNFEAQVWRERELNRALDEAWDAFKDGVDNDLILGPPADALDLLGPGKEKS
jgi:hypothetical protein